MWCVGALRAARSPYMRQHCRQTASTPRMIMSLHRWKGYIFIVFLALRTVDSSPVNFTQCLIDVIGCANSNGTIQACTSRGISDANTALSLLRTSHGSRITNVADSLDATALSYGGCVQACGTSQEPFKWGVFSQEFAAWLLPYLALLSQLPFGAKHRTDNLMSAILTLGSPTLAGYSLYMTFLNARWVNNQLFGGIDYPSSAVRQSVVRVLTSLQQVPLRVHPGQSGRFESLVIHPHNDNWWNTFSGELDYSHEWSISSATSIAWVVVAYLLTVADSLSNVRDNINSNGQGTGSVWLWLLPIVAGWFVLSPKCDYVRVYAAYDKANRQAFVADPRDPNANPTQVTSNFGLTIRPDPDWKLYNRNVTSPDELRIPPVFNYARMLSWSRAVCVTSLFYRAAWRKSNNGIGVDGEQIDRNPGDDVPRGSRLGHRDQIIQYCYPDHRERPTSSFFWPRGILFNMVIASLMSLQLQWGTTCAAVLVVLFTPTAGLGCRSLAYLVYGTLSTVAWFLLVLSNILGDYARHLMDDSPAPDLESEGRWTPSTPAELSRSALPSIKFNGRVLSESVSVSIPLQEIRSHHVSGEGKDDTSADKPAPIEPTKRPHALGKHARTIARVADWLRWIGKLVAVFNAIGIIANSIFQYASVYDNCYCDSSVFTWRSSAFNVITPTSSDLDLAKKAWIGALALALTCCAFFVGTIYLIRDSLPS